MSSTESSKVFVDTFFFIAAINPRDPYHRRARSWASTLRQRPLLTTEAVLLEAGNDLAKAHRREIARTIEEYIGSDETGVVSLSPTLLSRGLDLFKRHEDKAWGLVDCLSFVAMREAGIAEALTFDHHFTQAGFRPLKNSDPPSE